MSSKLTRPWHPSDSVFSFSLVIFEAFRWKKKLHLIFCNRLFYHLAKAQRSATYFILFFLNFSILFFFFLGIFLTLDPFSFKFDGAVIMALTSSLERRRVMPLRSDASGTLQVGWQGLFPRLWSDDLLERVNVCSARKFPQPWLRASGLLPALWIRVHSFLAEDE